MLLYNAIPDTRATTSAASSAATAKHKPACAVPTPDVTLVHISPTQRGRTRAKKRGVLLSHGVPPFVSSYDWDVGVGYLASCCLQLGCRVVTTRPL